MKLGFDHKMHQPADTHMYHSHSEQSVRDKTGVSWRTGSRHPFCSVSSGFQTHWTNVSEMLLSWNNSLSADCHALLPFTGIESFQVKKHPLWSPQIPVELPWGEAVNPADSTSPSPSVQRLRHRAQITEVGPAGAVLHAAESQEVVAFEHFNIQ